MMTPMFVQLRKGKSQIIFPLILLFLLTIPAFWRMFRPGIFSMHDFHIFRLFEFNRCIQDLQIPCRWAPDSGFGYGEPLFNFYGQFPYILGEPLILAGIPILTTIKIIFAFSLFGSAVAMFLLVRYLFRSNIAAIVSAILYVYAPYRAVDVWVRGALPEALAFIFFPIILLVFLKYLREEKLRYLLSLSLLFALLLITHNLSFLMFLPFFGIWALYFLMVEKKWKLVKNFILAAFLTGGLVAFYILPVVFEGSLVNLGKTTQDYYNFRAHFTTLNQLLISRVWGYGASQFGPDDVLSFSVGHIQWTLSLLILLIIILTRRVKEYYYLILVIGAGWLALFLTHGRSLPIWEIAKPVSYIQFPWRFLTMGVFFFAMASGSIVIFFRNQIIRVLVGVVIVGLAVSLNYSFFREDQWFEISDQEQFSGDRWVWQTSSAVNDFWPVYGETIPSSSAPNEPVFLQGEGEIINFDRKSNSASSQVVITSDNATVQFPIVYFDGWVIDKEGIGRIYPGGEFGQITTTIPAGEHQISLRFTNTLVRTLGNLLTFSSIVILVGLFFRQMRRERRNEI